MHERTVTVGTTVLFFACTEGLLTCL